MVERLGEWLPFSSELYCRKLCLYDHMMWNDGFCLSACALVSLAPFGGSVAVIPVLTELEVPRVDVYSSAGELQCTLQIPGDVGTPIGMDWTKEESLVVLTDAQVCVFYDSITVGPASSVLTAPSRTIRLHDDNAGSVPVALFCMKTDGILCVDREGWMRGVLHGERRTSEILALVRLELHGVPSAMDFLPAERNDDGDTVVYITTRPAVQVRESELCVFTSDRGFGLRLCNNVPGDVLEMRLDNAGARLAIFTDEAVLYILTSNLQSITFSIRLGLRSQPPEKMEWCGSSFVMLHFKNSSFMKKGYASRADSSMFSLLMPVVPQSSVQCEKLDWDGEDSGYVATVAEVDGVRVVTERACYLIEEIHKSLVSLCRIKPLSQSAQLVLAYRDYAKGDLKGLPDIRHMLSKIGNAAFAELLDEIIDAATNEFSTDQQHRLLAAASFANEVNRQYDSDTLLDVVRRLRVLHALRHQPGCQMPLSFRQYSALSGSGQMRALAPSEAQVLVDRLTNRRAFQLALDIATTLNMSPVRLLAQWSCHKVQDVRLSDATVHAQITEALQRHPCSSYVECAVAALLSGRGELAVKLLNEDIRVHRKVTLFLILGQLERAVHWASQSDDADLLHLTLSKVVSSGVEESELLASVFHCPVAVTWLMLGTRLLPSWRPLVKDWCVKYGGAGLTMHYAHYQLLQMIEANKRWKECVVENDSSFIEEFGEILTPPTMSDAVKALAQSRQQMRSPDAHEKTALFGIQSFSADTAAQEDQWLSFHQDLEREQQQLTEEYKDPRFCGVSVIRTIHLCLLHGVEKRAEDIRVKFRVGEKLYCYTKLLALCEAGRWDDVERLGGIIAEGTRGLRFAEKPAIGYLPFIEHLNRHAQLERAMRFVPALDGIIQRIEWYMALGNPMKAIDDAFNERDGGLIQQIMKKTHDSASLGYGERRLKELDCL